MGDKRIGWRALLTAAALLLGLSCGGRSGQLWSQGGDLSPVDAGVADSRVSDLLPPDQQAPAPDLGPVPPEWTTTFGGSGASLIKALAVHGPGAVYVAGAYSGTGRFGSHTCAGYGSYDLFLVRLGKDGGVQWALCGGGSGHDSGLGLAVGPGGDLWLSGEYNGTATLGSTRFSSHGSSDIFLARVSPAGKVRWVVVGGGGGMDRGSAVTVDPTSGAAYLAGSVTAAANLGPHKLKASGLATSFFARVSPTGDFVWAVGAASDTWSQPAAVRLSAGGALYAAGNFGDRFALGGKTLKGTSASQGYLARLDSAGKVSWAVAATGPRSVELSAIDTDAGGALYATGKFRGTMNLGALKVVDASGANLFNRAFVVKLSPSGAGAWILSDGGDGLSSGEGRVVRVSPAPTGAIHLLGSCISAYDLGGHKLKDKGPFLARLTATGKATWSLSLQPRDSSLMELDAAGGVYLAQEELKGVLRVYKLTP